MGQANKPAEEGVHWVRRGGEGRERRLINHVSGILHRRSQRGNSFGSLCARASDGTLRGARKLFNVDDRSRRYGGTDVGASVLREGRGERQRYERQGRNAADNDE